MSTDQARADFEANARKRITALLAVRHWRKATRDVAITRCVGRLLDDAEKLEAVTAGRLSAQVLKLDGELAEHREHTKTYVTGLQERLTAESQAAAELKHDLAASRVECERLRALLDMPAAAVAATERPRTPQDGPGAAGTGAGKAARVPRRTARPGAVKEGT